MPEMFEPGYMFLPEAWGYGYAAEACAAALDWFAGALPSEPVVLCTQTANDRSMHEGFAEETAIETAAVVLATNLFGVARVINAVPPQMRGRRSGRIINVGSLAAWVGEPGEGFYAASKAALARYTEALRHESRHDLRALFGGDGPGRHRCRPPANPGC